MANVAPQLQEAYDLIESGDLQSARQLLDDIRPDNENNPDFWWVYAHAVENENDGMAALERVRQLAPNYAGLHNFQENIYASTPQPQGIQSLRPTTAPPSTADVEEFYEDEDKFDAQPSESSGNNGLIPFLLIAGIAVIVIIAGLFVISGLFNSNDANTDGTATNVLVVTDISPEPILPTFDSESVAGNTTNTPEIQATDVPIDTDEPPTATTIPTDEPSATPEPEDSDPIADIYSALESSGVPEDGIVLDDTNSFGDTYIITTCSAPGPVATENILNIMDELQSISDNLDEAASGFAFAITDCDADVVRLVLGFDRQTADNYWSGEIGQVELQQSLQRVD